MVFSEGEILNVRFLQGLNFHVTSLVSEWGSGLPLRSLKVEDPNSYPEPLS